ncbi:MAG TPA: DUF2203 domain-containing protein [Verrucomicrobiae bacterium]|nr:DUF2203 domain-containing protein [Verrucomicrobiae bacterium]
MGHQFTKHYTREEARTLLPQIREWLGQLAVLRASLRKHDQRVETLLDAGTDRGGQTVNDWVRTMADIQHVIMEFQSREIFIKDADRGLIDFPALIGGREVFLCWENGEADIEYWHDLESGYGGREKL